MNDNQKTIWIIVAIILVVLLIKYSTLFSISGTDVTSYRNSVSTDTQVIYSGVISQYNSGQLLNRNTWSQYAGGNINNFLPFRYNLQFQEFYLHSILGLDTTGFSYILEDRQNCNLRISDKQREAQMSPILNSLGIGRVGVIDGVDYDCWIVPINGDLINEKLDDIQCKTVGVYSDGTSYDISGTTSWDGQFICTIAGTGKPIQEGQVTFTYDPNYIPPSSYVAGDGICESDKGETLANSPSDCAVEIPEENDTCITDWQCTGWSECLVNLQNRTCTDLNSCNIFEDKPFESQSCGLIISGGSGGGSSGASCIKNSVTSCLEEDVYYYDSCGNLGDKIEECEFGCSEGVCLEKGGVSKKTLIIIALAGIGLGIYFWRKK